MTSQATPRHSALEKYRILLLDGLTNLPELDKVHSFQVEALRL